MLLWIPAHSGIQGNVGADALEKEGSSSFSLVLNQQFQSNHVLAGSRSGMKKKSTLHIGLPQWM
jgi:hypothetical protein